MTGRGRQYRQIETANQMLRQEALSDALTNLGNRNRFEKTIQAFEFDKHGCGTLGCIYIDVNGLHEINNHLGHQAGDRMLKTIFFALGEMSLSFCVKIWDARSWCAG